jgi:hypothetical protein
MDHIPDAIKPGAELAESNACAERGVGMSSLGGILVSVSLAQSCFDRTSHVRRAAQ